MPNDPRGSHDHRIDIFTDMLRQVPPGRLLDLATGHGKFALAAQELGWKVTAVDARTERMPMTSGIEWIQADVRDFCVEGYDVITLLGLLYHLELEAQSNLLKRCSSTLTLIDTHVSMRPTTMIQDYMGHFFEETVEDARASWGNPLSYWLTEESLFRLILSSGYSSILKLMPPPVTADRTFYVASPAAADELDWLRAGFNEDSHKYRLEPLLAGANISGVDVHELMAEIRRLHREGETAEARYHRLQSRKSVKVALGIAGTVRPVYKVLRRESR